MSVVSSAKQRHVVLHLFIQPKAKKTQFVGMYDNRIKLAIAAPPVDGKANKEVIAFLSSYFGLRKNAVKILSGERSRRKNCELAGVEERAVKEKLSFLF